MYAPSGVNSIARYPGIVHMPNSRNSVVAWEQIQCAYGDSREVGELLQRALAGEGVWGDLIGLVLHQDTLYEATVPVASWVVEALTTEKLGKRLIHIVNPASGKRRLASEKALAFWLLSGMAEVARDALNGGSRSEPYATLAALVLEALRPGTPLYEAGAKDPDDQVREASSTLLDALADDVSIAGDRLYERTLMAKLGMPLSRPLT